MGSIQRNWQCKRRPSMPGNTAGSDLCAQICSNFELSASAVSRCVHNCIKRLPYNAESQWRFESLELELRIKTRHTVEWKFWEPNFRISQAAPITVLSFLLVIICHYPPAIGFKVCVAFFLISWSVSIRSASSSLRTDNPNLWTVGSCFAFLTFRKRFKEKKLLFGVSQQLRPQHLLNERLSEVSRKSPGKTARGLQKRDLRPPESILWIHKTSSHSLQYSLLVSIDGGNNCLPLQEHRNLRLYKALPPFNSMPPCWDAPLLLRFLESVSSNCYHRRRCLHAVI